MRTVCQFITALVLVSGLFCSAQEAKYYRHLVSLIDTNDSSARGITSAFLTDTNNTAPKVTNAVAKLSQFKTSGEVSGIRLGVTMEEVIVRWGKPRWIWSRCYGGPRLCYADASVILEPSTNSVMTILLTGVWKRNNPPFTTAQTLNVLGEPKTRNDSTNRIACSLFYGTLGGTMRLDFSEDELICVRLANHAK